MLRTFLIEDPSADLNWYLHHSQ